MNVGKLMLQSSEARVRSPNEAGDILDED